MTRGREVAKFASGAVAFHALVHAYLWLSGVNLTIAGITQTSTWNMTAAILSLILSLALAKYGWGAPRRRIT